MQAHWPTIILRNFRASKTEDDGVQYWSHENIYIKFSLMTNIDLFMSNLIGLEAKKANIYLVGTF